jgi:hypothetical protein
MRTVYRYWVGLALGLLAIVGVALRSPAANQVEKVTISPARGQAKISLRDRLVVGLQARLKTEVAFCDKVALEVQLGHLPVRIVDETFLWARERAESAQYGYTYRPIVYFQPAMKLRAQKLRIVL